MLGWSTRSFDSGVFDAKVSMRQIIPNLTHLLAHINLGSLLGDLLLSKLSSQHAPAVQSSISSQLCRFLSPLLLHVFISSALEAQRIPLALAIQVKHYAGKRHFLGNVQMQFDAI